jgi:hypothetical protein
MAGQPVLGLEIIVLSRFQRGWQDFTAAELQTGGGSLIFEVPPGHSIESPDAGRFEFRFFHFGNASLTITSVELERRSPRVEQAPEPGRWRMLGRLQKSWIGARGRDGAVTVSRYAPPGCLLHGGWPYLRLPRGRYRLSVRAAAAAPHSGQQPVLAVEIFGDSRWRRTGPLTRLSRSPQTYGIRQARQEFAVADIACGNVSVDFAVPAERRDGRHAPFDSAHHTGNAFYGSTQSIL